MKLVSEQDMIMCGENFGREISQKAASASKSSLDKDASIVIELIGDVGAGKTTFTRGLARGLSLNEEITSPSYTISRSYALPSGKTLIHYDFYRLPDPGLMSEDLSENLSNPDNIIVIEWSDSIKDLLPKNHIVINIKYNDDNTRELTLS